jgi:hypothetical protein
LFSQHTLDEAWEERLVGEVGVWYNVRTGRVLKGNKAGSLTVLLQMCSSRHVQLDGNKLVAISSSAKVYIHICSTLHTREPQIWQ